LARPVIIGRSIVLVTVALAGLIGCMAAATYVSLWTLAPAGATWPSGHNLAMLMTHLYAIGWGFGCLSIAAASALNRRAAAMGLVALSAIGLFLIDFLVEMSSRFQALWWTTPFH